MVSYLARIQERLVASSIKHAGKPYANVALFGLGVAEALIFPLPVETLLVPLVFLRARPWYFYAALAATSTILGGLIGYGIGAFFFEAIGSTIVHWYGIQEEIEYVQTIALAYTFGATFIAAFTPIPDKIFMPIAGLLGAPFLPFTVGLVLGRTIRSFAVAFVTHKWGRTAAQLLLRYIKEVSVAALSALIGFLIAKYFLF